MKDKNLAVPLNAQTAAFLAKLFKVAETTESSTVQIIEGQGRWSGTFDITISGVRRRADAGFEDVEEIIENIPGQPMLDLFACGYVLRHEGMHVTLNYQLAQQRVKYEGKRSLGKWWMRATNDWGRFLLDVAAVVGGLWAATNMIRMLIEALT